MIGKVLITLIFVYLLDWLAVMFARDIRSASWTKEPYGELPLRYKILVFLPRKTVDLTIWLLNLLHRLVRK